MKKSFLDYNKLFIFVFDILIFTTLSSLISYTIFYSILKIEFIYFWKMLIPNLIIWTVFSISNIKKPVLFSVIILTIITLSTITYFNYDAVMLYINELIKWMFNTESSPQVLEMKPFGQDLFYLVQIPVFLFLLIIFYLKRFIETVIAFGIIAFVAVFTLSVNVKNSDYLPIYLIFLGLLLLLVASSIYKKEYKLKNGKLSVLAFFSKRIVAYLFVSLVFVAFMNFIPLNYKSDNLFETIESITDDISNIGDGFSNKISSKLGGSNNQNGDVDFLIKENNSKKLYLKCEVYDIYTGSSFEKSDKLNNIRYTDIQDRKLIDIPSLSSVENESYSIKMVDYKSNVLPVPNYFTSVSSNDFDTNDSLKTSEQGEVFYNKNFKDEEINVSFWDFNRSYFYSSYIENAQIDFLSLPKTVTERTVQLADEITEIHKANQYDSAVALSNYLKNNYRYTLKPKEVHGSDFVDSFLFEHKEGYCTSFASSLFVMLRTQNIPCVYVVGYCVDDEKESNELEGYYEVTDKQLHAWVEVYMDGLGTVVIDPVGAGSEEMEQVTPTPSPVESTTPSPTPKPMATEKPVNTPKPTVENVTEKEKEKPFDFSSLILIVTVIITLFLLWCLYSKRQKFIRNKLSSKDTKILYETLINLLSILKIQRETGETVREFFTRVCAMKQFNNKVDFNNLVSVIEEYLYLDSKAINDNDSLIKFVKTVNQYTKQNTSKIWYFIKF